MATSCQVLPKIPTTPTQGVVIPLGQAALGLNWPMIQEEAGLTTCLLMARCFRHSLCLRCLHHRGIESLRDVFWRLSQKMTTTTHQDLLQIGEMSMNHEIVADLFVRLKSPIWRARIFLCRLQRRGWWCHRSCQFPLLRTETSIHTYRSTREPYNDPHGTSTNPHKSSDPADLRHPPTSYRERAGSTASRPGSEDSDSGRRSIISSGDKQNMSPLSAGSDELSGRMIVRRHTGQSYDRLQRRLGEDMWEARTQVESPTSSTSETSPGHTGHY